MKYPIKDFISKCDQIPRKLQAWSHLQKQSFIKNFTLLCSKFFDYFQRSGLITSVLDIYFSIIVFFLVEHVATLDAVVEHPQHIHVDFDEWSRTGKKFVQSV